MEQLQILKEMFSDYKSFDSFVNKLSETISIPRYYLLTGCGIKPSSSQYISMPASNRLFKNDFVLDVAELDAVEYHIKKFMSWVDIMKNKKAIYYELKFLKVHFIPMKYTHEQQEVIKSEFNKTDLAKHYKLSTFIDDSSYIHVALDRKLVD